MLKVESLRLNALQKHFFNVFPEKYYEQKQGSDEHEGDADASVRFGFIFCFDFLFYGYDLFFFEINGVAGVGGAAVFLAMLAVFENAVVRHIDHCVFQGGVADVVDLCEFVGGKSYFPGVDGIGAVDLSGADVLCGGAVCF